MKKSVTIELSEKQSQILESVGASLEKTPQEILENVVSYGLRNLNQQSREVMKKLLGMPYTPER